MIEPDFYIQKEEKLLALANSRFAVDLSPAESKVLRDSVRPGVPEPPKGTDGEVLPPNGRAVRPQLLRWIVVDRDAFSLIDINGIWVMHATIQGHLDLADCKASFGFNFLNCVFTELVAFSNAAVKALIFEKCHVFKGVEASGIKCEDYLRVTDSVIEGQLSVEGGKATDVSIDKSKLLRGVDAIAFDCHGEFGMTACECDGEMRFDNARIGTDFFLTGSHVIANKEYPQLNLRGVSIGHNLWAQFNGRVRFRCGRSIEATDLEVGGNLVLNGAELAFGGDALRLDVANIRGELFLLAENDLVTGKPVPFTCNGTIHMPHIHIGQDIHADGAVLNCEGLSLNMTSAEMPAGAAFLTDLKCAGRVLCIGVHIADGLWLEGAKFTQTGTVLQLDDAVIGKYLTLERIETPGSISMNGGTIDGTFSCNNAKIDSLLLAGVRISHDLVADGTEFTSRSLAVSLSSVQVNGKVQLNSATSSAYFRFKNCNINEPLSFIGTKINVGSDENAVHMERVELGQSLWMYGGFETNGAVKIENGSIGGNISCIGAKMDRLGLVRVRCAGNLYWFGIKNGNETALNLYDSSLRSLYDDRLSWPGKGLLSVINFTYRSLELRKSPSPDQLKKISIPDAEKQTADDRVEWLKLQNSNDVTAPEPWLQLSRFLSERGDDAGAKHVLYMMRRVRGYSEGRIARLLSLPYDLVEENPLNITYPILGLWGLGSLVFWRARRMQAMAPTDSTAFDRFKHKQPMEGYVPFHPVVYTLENVLPVVKFGQDSAWAPNPEAVKRPRTGWKRWLPGIDYRSLVCLRWTLIMLGWALALILAGAIAARFKS